MLHLKKHFIWQHFIGNRPSFMLLASDSSLLVLGPSVILVSGSCLLASAFFVTPALALFILALGLAVISASIFSFLALDSSIMPTLASNLAAVSVG
jgi:hypothetical protein